MAKRSFKLPIVLLAISITLAVLFVPYVISDRHPEPGPERTAMLTVSAVLFVAAIGLAVRQFFKRPT